MQLYRAQTSEVEGVVHKVEVSGLLAPWTVDRLRCCLQDSLAGSGFRMAATPHGLAANLNWLPAESERLLAEPGSKPCPEAAAPGGWCCPEERSRWTTPSASLEGGVVTDMQYDAAEQQYSVAVTARPTGS